jgi:hypothetical protein
MNPESDELIFRKINIEKKIKRYLELVDNLLI